MPTSVSGLSITRIEELDSAIQDLFKDKTKLLLAVMEVDGKVYKFNLREAVAILSGKDENISSLTNRIETLENKLNNLLTYGFSEASLED